jgi:outer membrane protein
MRFTQLLAGAAILWAAASPVIAQKPEPGRIGIVNTTRIMRDAAVSQRAQRQIESEFQKRDQEMAALAERIKRMSEDLQKNALTMSESVRQGRERELGDLNREFQRKQREFNEDLAQRRNEASAQVIEKANRVIRQIAEQDKLDIILQDAVFSSPKLDITDRVIKALDQAEPR